VSVPHIAVVGSGVAGTAAAFTLARAGARVSVIHARAGSSALYSGALDDDGGGAALQGEGDAARTFAEALGLWKLGPVTLATREGVVRPAFGADSALLDLSPVAGKNVAVADVPRDDWDAPLLAGALSASPWAERTGTTFTRVSVSALRRGHERRLASHDFAALHDDPERLDALAALLAQSEGAHAAWLVGPWLGTRPGGAERLRRAVPIPVGETTSLVGGAAGARFEHARDALLAASSVGVVSARVVRVASRGEGWVVHFAPEDESEREKELEAEAVVLATGGVAAGGIEFVWEPLRGAHGYRLPFDAPVALALDGEPGDGGGSLYGASLEQRGLAVLERVGIDADARGAVFPAGEHRGLFAAGDALSARPRTVFEAVRSGIRAARSALLLGQA
jgi:glycerol-3-phosphate dehydrogenase subunit B